MTRTMKWVLAIVAFVLIWSIGTVILELLLLNTGIEMYSGLIALAVGVVVAIAILDMDIKESSSRTVIQENHNSDDPRKRILQIDVEISKLKAEKHELEKQLIEDRTPE